jgi:hypothetical protein
MKCRTMGEMLRQRDSTTLTPYEVVLRAFAQRTGFSVTCSKYELRSNTYENSSQYLSHLHLSVANSPEENATLKNR